MENMAKSHTISFISSIPNNCKQKEHPVGHSFPNSHYINYVSDTFVIPRFAEVIRCITVSLLISVNTISPFL